MICDDAVADAARIVGINAAGTASIGPQSGYSIDLQNNGGGISNYGTLIVSGSGVSGNR